jgi:hypothetical protein
MNGDVFAHAEAGRKKWRAALVSEAFVVFLG